MNDPSHCPHSSPLNIITSAENIDSTVYNCIADISDKMIEVKLVGTGRTIDYVESVKLCLSKYKIPLCSSYIELPLKLRNNYIVNIKNDDNFCFLWCVVDYLHPAIYHSDRVSNYAPYFNELNLNGFNENDFPPHLKQIEKFSKQNNIQINVFELNDNCTLTYHHMVDTDEDGCNLLFYKCHYVLCKDVSPYFRYNHSYKCYPCLKCRRPFKDKDKQCKHFEI